MQRLLSTYLYVQQKLTPALLSDIESAGFHGVEIFCTGFHFNYRSQDVVREIADWFGDHKMKLHSLHAPTSRNFSSNRESGTPVSLSEPERMRRIEAVDEIKHALDVAEILRFEKMIVHLGGSREADDPRRWDSAFTSLEHLTIFAKQRGVLLAVENTPGEMATPAKLRHFLEDTRLPNLRLCFDVGHAHMEGESLTGLELVRDFAATSHIHDNHGDKDEHLLPYEGTVEWDELLSKIPAELPMVFEFKEQQPGTPSLDAIRKVVERIEEQRAKG